MKYNSFIHILIVIQTLYSSNCNSNSGTEKIYINDSVEKIVILDSSLITSKQNAKIITGAEQYDLYKHLISDKRIAVITNQTGLIGKEHIVDFLINKKENLKKIFVPEHGFRGDNDRGMNVSDDIDEKTGLPIVSLYGKSKKPSSEQLKDVDIVLFDIQDVGVRFFTYISTMHYIMEACAENNKKVIVLDRPNPLGDYIDGPVLDLRYRSFVGLHPIPVVHGLTVGELAMMINGERWLDNGLVCDLHIVKMENYDHNTRYSLPVKPSPNLPNDISIRLYPSLCFFEATGISIGRGTDFPFQVIGYPDSKFGEFTFIPEDKPGMQMNPVHKASECFGIDLRETDINTKFTLRYLIEFAEKFAGKDEFISRSEFFNLLAGNSILEKQIKSEMSEKEIKETWQSDLRQYKKMRRKYLLYKDFE